MASSSSRVRVQMEAAKQLGVSAKTLQTWERAAWFPKGGRTKAGYDVAAIQAARPKADIEREAEQESPLRKKAREAEHVKTIEAALREAVRRETDQLKLRVAQGELIPRHGIEQSYADLLTGIADWCAQLPDLFSSMSSTPMKYRKADARLIRQLIEQKQHELAAELEHKALSRDGRPDDDERLRDVKERRAQRQEQHAGGTPA